MLKVNCNLRNFAEMYYSMQMEEKNESQVLCTYCIRLPAPAVKTCLHCEVSLCCDHLKVHPSSADHILIKPTGFVTDHKGSVYKNIQEPEMTYVSCFPGEHTKDATSIDEAYEIQRERLTHFLDQLTSKKDDIDHQICNFQRDVKEKQDKALQLAEKVTDLFRRIRWQLEEQERGVLAKIFRGEDQLSKQVSHFIQQLENEKKDLLKKMQHIEELLDAADSSMMLQDEELHRDDFCEYLEGGYLTIERRESLPSAVEVPDESMILETLHSGLYDIVTSASRRMFIREAPDIFLDTQTAANNVALSEDLKTASLSAVCQDYPLSPARFVDCQVLSSTSFCSGHHYWEVESSKRGDWMIGMAYATIDRSGDRSWLGENEQSWCLARLQNTYSAIHAAKEKVIPQLGACHRLRIYLDYEAGRLSFYELSDTIRHMHTFNATFTEPLYPVVGLLQNKDWCWVRIKS